MTKKCRSILHVAERTCFREVDVGFRCCFWGLKMRLTDPTELACHQTALEGSNKNVYDLGLKQGATSRLRRIRDLEHENTLLMRMVSETQIEIARLREQLFSE